MLADVRKLLDRVDRARGRVPVSLWKAEVMEYRIDG
jgi:hypothetical protein